MEEIEKQQKTKSTNKTNLLINTEEYCLLTLSQHKANYYMNYIIKNNNIGSPTFFETPNVIQISTWLQNQYKTLKNRKAIVNPQQKSLIIMGIIKNDNPTMDHGTVIKLAQSLNQTFNQLTLMMIPQAAIKDHYITDTKTCAEYLNAYENALFREGLIDNISLANEVIQAIQNKTIKLKHKIIFDSITDIPALYYNLYMEISKYGSALNIDQKYSSKLSHHKSLDRFHAIHDFLEWTKTLNKDAKICLSIPNLQTNITEIKRNISNLIGVKSQDTEYISICSNNKISDKPIIKSTLLLLEIIKPQLKIEAIISLIKNPYLFNENLEVKLELLEKLKDIESKNEVYISTEKIINELYCYEDEQPNVITKNLIDLFESIASLPETLSLHEMLISFNRLLEIASWPCTYNDEDLTACNKFKEITGKTKYYSYYHKPDTIETITATFTSLISNYRMLKDNPNAKIQVIDINETLNRDFTHIWYAYLDEKNFPCKNQFSNAIPPSICDKYQIAYGMNNKAIQVSTRLIEQITSNTSNTVLNYNSEDSGLRLNPSSFITKYLNDNNKLELNTTNYNYYPNRNKRPHLQIRQKSNHLPLANNENRIGTYHLKEHQTCHFRAFSKYRLKASDQDAPALGISNKDRGIVIHNVLQSIYNKYRSSSELKLLVHNHDYLHKTIKDHLTTFIYHKKFSANKNYIKTEVKSIFNIILEYINIELQRPNFTVDSLEKKLSITIDNIEINGIIDRIDKVDHNYILIDYKTGKANHSSWFGDTISDPQLPIYALSYRNKAAAVTFAKLNSIKVIYSGIALPEYQFSDISVKYKDYFENWSELETYWFDSITSIVKSYQTGSTALTVKKPNTTCINCTYQRLCRIWEQPTENQGNE